MLRRSTALRASAASRAAMAPMKDACATPTLMSILAKTASGWFAPNASSYSVPHSETMQAQRMAEIAGLYHRGM